MKSDGSAKASDGALELTEAAYERMLVDGALARQASERGDCQDRLSAGLHQTDRMRECVGVLEKCGMTRAEIAKRVPRANGSGSVSPQRLAQLFAEPEKMTFAQAEAVANLAGEHSRLGWRYVLFAEPENSRPVAGRENVPENPGAFGAAEKIIREGTRLNTACKGELIVALAAVAELGESLGLEGEAAEVREWVGQIRDSIRRDSDTALDSQLKTEIGDVEDARESVW